MLDKIFPISVAKFAAYLDGNLSEQDMAKVTNEINEDPLMMELSSISNLIDEEMADIESLELPSEIVNEDFVIPSQDSSLSATQVSTMYSDVSAPNTYLNMDEHDDKFHIGHKPNDGEDTFDPQIYQGHQPTCAICSQEIVMRDFGVNIPREELINYATKQGWFIPDPEHGGTPKEDVGNLLDSVGIETTRYDHATLSDILRELAAGHRIIVSVDANELWIKKNPNFYSRLFGELKNKLNDAVDSALNIEGANHALVVAGVNINPNNPKDINVVLIDTGSGDYCIEYSWDEFRNALADSNNYVVATKEAAPYQYNYQTHELEPSGFESNFVPSMAQLPEGLHNNYVLPQNYYEQYEYYHPTYGITNALDSAELNNIGESTSFSELTADEESEAHVDEYEDDFDSYESVDEPDAVDQDSDGFHDDSEDDDNEIDSHMESLIGTDDDES